MEFGIFGGVLGLIFFAWKLYRVFYFYEKAKEEKQKREDENRKKLKRVA